MSVREFWLFAFSVSSSRDPKDNMTLGRSLAVLVTLIAALQGARSPPSRRHIHYYYYRTGPKVDLSTQPGGDIQQFRDLLQHPGRAANALPPTSRFKWRTQDADGNYQIPYVISGPFRKNQVRMILTAMVRIQKNTCIRFVRRTRESDFIDLKNIRGEGCYSYVGNHGGRSYLNLESSSKASCMYHEIVIHELLHSVGLWHEHMRHDRDKHIKVHSENVARGMFGQFVKIPVRDGVTYNTAYDFNSVMHYEKSAFAKRRGLVTMEPLDSRFLNVIGKAKDASASDYKKVCSIYNCGTCPGAPDFTPTPTTTTTDSRRRRAKYRQRTRRQ